MQLGSIYSFEDGCDLSSSCIITKELEHSPQREEVLDSTQSEWVELTSSAFNSEELNSSLRRMTIRKYPCFCFLSFPFLPVCEDCKLRKAPARLSLNV